MTTHSQFLHTTEHKNNIIVTQDRPRDPQKTTFSLYLLKLGEVSQSTKHFLSFTSKQRPSVVPKRLKETMHRPRFEKRLYAAWTPGRARTPIFC